MEGVYVPNNNIDASKGDIHVHEFMKKRGNFKKGEPPQESIFLQVPCGRKSIITHDVVDEQVQKQRQ